MLFVRDRLMCHMVWPICRRMPVGLYAAVCRVVAIPFAALLLWRQRGFVRDVARTLGRESLAGRIRLAIEMAWSRFT